jgi:hypothetical protein
MPEEIKSIPEAGPGSQTPTQVPNLHTPVGEGADAVGVQNIGKTPGAPGAPAKPAGGVPEIGGASGGAAPAGGAIPAKGKPPLPPQKTPEQILQERSEHRLKEDIKDILVTNTSDEKTASIKQSRASIDDIDLDTLISRLVDEKGWRVNRLKELLPSREEKDIIQYFRDLLEDEKSDITDNTQIQNNIPETKRSSNMTKQLLVNNGSLESKVDITDSLNQLSYAVDSVSIARKALAEGIVKKAGLDALGEGLGLDMKEDLGFSGGDVGLDGGLGGGDLESLLRDLKDKVEELSMKLKDFGKEKDGLKLDADSSLKSDAMMGKAKQEKDKGLGAISNFEKKPGGPMGEKKPGGPIEEKKPGGPMGEKKPEGLMGEKKEEEDEKKEPIKEEKAASSEQDTKTAMDAASGGKKVPLAEAAAPKDSKKGGDPMKATMEAKASVLDKIKERMAKLNELKKEAQLYPFKDLNKQNQEDINRQTAGDQASEINSDMKSGEMSKDKTDKFLGQGREKTQNPAAPAMDLSKDFNKAASTTEGVITLKQANAIKQHEVEETVAKVRLAVEVASVQQLKGLVSNPLKEAMIKNMTDAGMEKTAAEAIAYNSFVDGYEASQREVLAEAFDTLAKQNMEEFVKVASFTKQYAGEFDTSVKEGGNNKQVKTASDKSSVALRGSQVGKDSDNKYTNFWRQTYADQKSGK